MTVIDRESMLKCGHAGKRWLVCVLLMCSSVLSSIHSDQAEAANPAMQLDKSALPGTGMFDYRESVGKKDKNGYLFFIPRDAQAVQSPILANTCIKFAGFSIEWQEYENFRITKQNIVQLFQEKFWQAEERKKDDPQSAPVENKSSEELDQTQVGEDAVAQTHKSNANSNVKVDRCQNLEKNNKINKEFSADVSDEHGRLQIKFQNGESHWVSLWSISRIVNHLTDLLRIDPKKSGLLEKIFFIEHKENNYFLSRAYLPEQSVCGLNLNEKGQPTEEPNALCGEVPEMFKIDIIHGIIGNVGIQTEAKIETFVEKISNSFTGNDKKSEILPENDYIDNKKISVPQEAACVLADLGITNKLKNYYRFNQIDSVISSDYQINADLSVNSDRMCDSLGDEAKKYIQECANKLMKKLFLCLLPYDDNEHYDSEICDDLKDKIAKCKNKIDIYKNKKIDYMRELQQYISKDTLNSINQYVNLYRHSNIKLTRNRIEKHLKKNRGVIPGLHNAITKKINYCYNGVMPCSESEIIIYRKASELFNNNKHNEFISLVSDNYESLINEIGDLIGSSEIKEAHKALLPYNCKQESEGKGGTKVASSLCDMVRPVLQGKPITQHAIDQHLTQLGQLPGMDVGARLQNAGESEQPGASNLLLIPETQHYEATVGTDNYGNKYMGPWLMWGKLAAHPFYKPGDDLSILYVQAKDAVEFKYLQLDYRYLLSPLQLGDFTLESGWYTRGSYKFDKGYLGYDLKKYDTYKTGWSVDLAVGKESYIDRYLKRSLEASVTLAETRSEMFLKKVNHDRVSKFNISPRYEYYREYLETGESGSEGIRPGFEDVNFSLNFSKGIDFLGFNNENGDPYATRQDANANFFQVRTHLKGVREFRKKRSEDTNSPFLSWLFDKLLIAEYTDRFFISGEFDYQYSNSILPSVEEVSYGGRRFGTSYDISKVSGDNGYGARAEIGWKFLDACLIDERIASDGLLCKFFNYFDPIAGRKNIFRDLEISPYAFLEYAQVRKDDSYSRAIGDDFGELFDGGVGVRLLLLMDTKMRKNNKAGLQQISIDASMAAPFGNTLSFANNNKPVLRGSIVFQFNLPSN
ncbi:ShlB/FhaC/HecB family hemolysin secretion/activation protein [Candidatus Magnetaquicoccus inordinatus]|uniref:ShlB/FhaC/HecB family hemolysin secretion/activation protein n=1 Tax=Candidatus Magnetaquicoccus inordinatus TaxID=2496818 RepID=UPI00102AB754|nr:ShlB/FhaC/HecB family hemolysin secretion/activation protein [Candidatus Magnetaquicoccus inordinatus]